LKGIPDPVEIFRLIGLKPAVNSEHFRGASLMPLRGRAVEMETLQRALLDSAPGSPRVIGVSGPPGVGKSRFCFEFGEWCRERQIKVLEARAQVHSRSTPLVPVLEALRATACVASPGRWPGMSAPRIPKNPPESQDARPPAARAS
jgi:predicted ATPase